MLKLFGTISSLRGWATSFVVLTTAKPTTETEGVISNIMFYNVIMKIQPVSDNKR